MPVLETNSEEEDEHKDGSEKYIQLDPKIFGRAGLSGNDLRSLKWSPRYVYQRAPRGAFSSSALALKRYPKNVKVIHEYEAVKDYPHKVKSHRIIKHQLVPTYDIQEDSEDDYSQPEGQEDYAESKPVKSYLRQPNKSQKSSQIQFIPASEVSQYIPTIPYSALKNQFNPIWTPTDFISNLAKNKDNQRLGRSSRYEGTTMRVFSTGAGDYSSPIHLDRFSSRY